ncbi:MAG: 5-(carboxyamino)imidazole ribonucleotide mutase [Thermodesulfobacteriota bacterium]|nr:5-(carboxyamino)imidazole ribonucleotide mutase [Thermodesulfobacteriota bacterium]
MKVVVVMGSKSDLPVMEESAAIIKEFNVECEMRILSAHRCPQEVAAFSTGARERGVDIIIAGAGMAAHLPGIIAAYTTLPVIGVPIDASSLNGMDALLAMVQMPPGIPVATSGIGKAGARNAGLLAMEILSVSNKDMADRLSTYRRDMKNIVLEADRALHHA